ncbi:MAG: hypothetical protein NTV05_11785 [Acidobacteria bacterium]|nr:hypothetical protein [Acidobacteriota bacterium]
MPPRFAYWTIILDGTATSFRAREQAELLPTFNQLKKKNPGAIMKWFSGGTLWDSPEQASEKRRLERERLYNEARAREDRAREQRVRDERPRDQRAPLDRPGSGPADRKPRTEPRPRSTAPGTGAPRRSKSWRPGGEHRDPKDKYKLPPGEARKRWKKRNLGPGKPKS